MKTAARFQFTSAMLNPGLTYNVRIKSVDELGLYMFSQSQQILIPGKYFLYGLFVTVGRHMAEYIIFLPPRMKILLHFIDLPPTFMQ